MSFLLTISYVFSSTKLEKRVEQVLPGSEGLRGWESWRGSGINNVYTCK
jgi:hypothetical protein